VPGLLIHDDRTPANFEREHGGITEGRAGTRMVLSPDPTRAGAVWHLTATDFELLRPKNIHLPREMARPIGIGNQPGLFRLAPQQFQEMLGH
jgi:hypothetical protein